MYVERYWGNYIGGTDDSLTLLDYFMDQQKCEIALKDIFTDTGLEQLNWDFRATEPGLEYKSRDGGVHEFDYAIDLVTDLAALMLECKVNGSIPLGQLCDDADGRTVTIIATSEEQNALNKALADFYADPLDYDLHEMVSDEDMQEMAQACEDLRRELFE